MSSLETFALNSPVTDENDDLVNLYITKQARGNYSASFVEAITIPFSEKYNNFNKRFQNLSEIVLDLKYPTYNYNIDLTNPTITTTQVNLPYIISESPDFISAMMGNTTYNSPFLATLKYSLESPFGQLEKRYRYKFDIHIPYALTTYTNTAGGGVEITGSIKNNVNNVIQQGSQLFYKHDIDEPVTLTLEGEYDTVDTSVTNLGFYIDVFFPKRTLGSSGANPATVELSNLELRETISSFYESTNKTSKIKKKFEFKDYYYIELLDPIEVFTETYVSGKTVLANLSLVPGFVEDYDSSQYNIDINSINDQRKSKNNIKLTYNSDSIFPANLSLLNNTQSLNDLFFRDRNALTEVRDSNYDSLSWTLPRYIGSKETGSLGDEPSLSFSSFEGIIFDSGSTSSTIKSIISQSLDSVRSTRIYYNSYVNFKNTSYHDLAFYNYYNSYSGSVNNFNTVISPLLPYNAFSEDIYPAIEGSTLYSDVTFFYVKVNKKFVKLNKKKVYKLDSSNIYNINQEGKVFKIE